jgi:hypothetical protein
MWVRLIYRYLSSCWGPSYDSYRKDRWVFISTKQITKSLPQHLPLDIW